ncbi:hypothetical protein DFH27DRAFT_618577 [Peziza echinospora]|nr:hypothetical protein DFH27DRAFT_618577 [Peziza echinospora]
MAAEFTYVRGAEPTNYTTRLDGLAARGSRRLTWTATQTSASYPHASAASAEQARTAEMFLEIVGTVYTSPDQVLTWEQAAALPTAAFQQLASRIAQGIVAFQARGGTPSASPTGSPHSSTSSIPRSASSSRSSIAQFLESSRGNGRPPDSGPPSSGSGARSSTRSSRPTRLASVRGLVRARDATCVLSGETNTECAHILAHSLGGGGGGGGGGGVAFLALVHMLCGPERAGQVEGLLGDRGAFARIDRAENCLLLSIAAHSLFGRGRLAFLPRLDLPVDSDAEPGTHNHTTTRAYYVEVVYPFGPAPIADWRAFYDDGLRRSTLVPPPPSAAPPRPGIATGSLIHLTTADPQNMPLPHPLLLDIHYTLSCVLAAKAQAEARALALGGEPDRDDGEDMIVHREMEEAGDSTLQETSLDSVTRVGTSTSMWLMSGGKNTHATTGTRQQTLAEQPVRSIKTLATRIWRAITKGGKDGRGGRGTELNAEVGEAGGTSVRSG